MIKESESIFKPAAAQVPRRVELRPGGGGGGHSKRDTRWDGSVNNSFRLHLPKKEKSDRTTETWPYMRACPHAADMRLNIQLSTFSTNGRTSSKQYLEGQCVVLLPTCEHSVMRVRGLQKQKACNDKKKRTGNMIQYPFPCHK